MASILNIALSKWAMLIRKSDTGLLSLPEDIIVNHIFYWLNVKEIVQLRRVCKGLAILTKKPSIWKRLLPLIPQLSYSFAPLPPTRTYGLRALTSHDMETVVSRAISYDAEWKRQTVRPWGTFGGITYHHVEEMTVLPGGHYLVTSVKSLTGMYAIMIWALEHPATQRPTAILHRYTEARAYALTAKYMTVRGKKGIVISFLRKYHKQRADMRHIPENFEMGGFEDVEEPNMPLKYECTTLHVPFCVLDAVTDRHISPMTREYGDRIQELAKECDSDDVWNVVSRIRTGKQLGVVSLDIIDGQPYVCVVKRPDTIVFECLEDNVRSQLICRRTEGFETPVHSIWNFRIIPAQGCVLVVRSVQRSVYNAQSFRNVKNDPNALLIELFVIPSRAETRNSRANEVCELNGGPYYNVKISELQQVIPPNEDESITPILMKRDRERAKPISIFIRTKEGLLHRSMWPVELGTENSIGIIVSPREGTKVYNERLLVYSVHRSKNYHFKRGSSPHETSTGHPQSNSDSCCMHEEALWDGRVSISPRSCDDYRCLPGTRRAIILRIPSWYISTSPPVTTMSAFDNSEPDDAEYCFPPPNGIDPEENIVLESLGIGTTTHPGLDMHMAPRSSGVWLRRIKLRDEIQNQLAMGVTASCFDESIGRAVFATQADKRFHVVDFSFIRAGDKDDEKMDTMDDELLRDEQNRSNHDTTHFR